MRRSNLAPYYRWLTMVTAALILVQALLAGRGLWLDRHLIDYHGYLANALFLVAVAQLAFTVYLGIPGSTGKLLMLMNAALVGLILAQTGLGYSGRTALEARAWHIPLGVLIFGLTVKIMSMARQLRPSGDDRLAPGD